MRTIESLRDFIGKEEFMSLATKIYHVSHTKDYPNHEEWYYTKQVPGVLEGNRAILFVRNYENEIIAVACLKREEGEQKICTLLVQEAYRGLGIGTQMIEEAMKWLGTTKPLVTFPDYKLDMFRSMIAAYGWELTETVPNLYQEGNVELCFNGTLTKNQKPSFRK